MARGHATHRSAWLCPIPETCPPGEGILSCSPGPSGGYGLRFRRCSQGTGRQAACPGEAHRRVKHLASGPAGAALNDRATCSRRPKPRWTPHAPTATR
jgi:hypothetical protein